MSKFNQIQRALSELNGGAFQKLADTYLSRRGYENLNPLGSVVGADKVRVGTPDTLVRLADGRFAFAEHTTEKRGLYRKLSGDLEKCFDEEKTGVPVAEIAEVVFCYTSDLSPEEHAGLTKRCRERGVNPNLYGPGPIAFDLYQKYPGLARDFLGVKVDTGQIVGPGEFVSAYDKSPLATPLDTSFYFREAELQGVLDALGVEDVVIVSGPAGVGKSRLALEACARFAAAHPEYSERCILNRGADLFEDVRVHFSDSGKYLIFVDDANRVSGFTYILQLLHTKREDQAFKIVVTVRDYALEKVRESVKPYGGQAEVKLNPLEEKEIRGLLEDEYEIRNDLYLDRIAAIAKGNPRLAVMAARVAKHEGTLKSIRDVSALYNEYFSSIRGDLEDLGNQDLLRTAGIISFFRAVDRSNEEQMNSVTTAFGVTPGAFWQAARRLHELEVLDMYENEVVKFSDQVLSTYLFYLAFFKERTLDFSTLLKHFFPQQERKLADAVFPVLDAFDNGAVTDVMRPYVDEAWRATVKAGDQEGLLYLMNTFWFLKEIDTLLYLREHISGMEPEAVDLSRLEAKADSGIPSPSVLSVLGAFVYASLDNFKMALELLFEYVKKRPKDFFKVLYLLTEEFGFNYYSYTNGFAVQEAVVDELQRQIQAEGDESRLFSRLFLAVVGNYLRTRFHMLESKGRHTFQATDFEPPATPELFGLRGKLWGQLFRLYGDPPLLDKALDVINIYVIESNKTTAKEIIESDAALVLPFLERRLDPENYSHCVAVHEFLGLLGRRHIPFDASLRERFSSEIYVLSKLFIHDPRERSKFREGDGTLEEYRYGRIKAHFSPYTTADYDTFFRQSREIQISPRTKQSEHIHRFQVDRGVGDVFTALAERDQALFKTVLGRYLQLGDPLGLTWISRITRHLIQSHGAEGALALLQEFDYPTKPRWLLSFYQNLASEQIEEQHVEHLYVLYRDARPEDMVNVDDLDYLLEYQAVDVRVVPKVVEIVVERVEFDSRCSFVLEHLVDGLSEISKNLMEIFENDVEVLKRAYLTLDGVERHCDYDGTVFSYMLDVDQNFFLEYIDDVYKDEGHVSRHDGQRDFSFLWLREDYEQLMTRAVERVHQHETAPFRLPGTYLKAFFILEQGKQGADLIRKRQEQLLGELVEFRHADVTFMRHLFEVISNFSEGRRRPLISLFLARNASFEAFRGLRLEPNHWDWSGSRVSVLQARIDFFESLLPLLNTVRLLEHRRFIEYKIQGLREDVEREKKENFVEAGS